MKHVGLSWLHAPLIQGALTSERLKGLLQELSKTASGKVKPETEIAELEPESTDHPSFTAGVTHEKIKRVRKL